MDYIVPTLLFGEVLQARLVYGNYVIPESREME